MRRALKILTYATLGTIAAAACGQTASPGANSDPASTRNSLNLTWNTDSSRGCPVSMSAKQGGFGNLTKVRRGPGSDTPGAERPKEAELSTTGRPGIEQQIRLTLENPSDGPTVLSATLLVKGTSGKGVVIHAHAGPEPAEISRTLEVHFLPEDKTHVAANLTLNGFTSVSTVVLKSIAYADGTSWKPSETTSCRTFPDPVLLVSLP